jgi:predicted enzyme related to lactoylglutathione lyase
VKSPDKETNPKEMSMTTPAIGSILVGSTDPDRLRSWYRDAFAPDQPEQGALDVGGVLLVFDKRSEVADKNPEPVRTMVNFHVEDAHETVAHLNAIGVTWIAELEKRPSGFFATLLDPDGSYVQIIEFTAEENQ